MEMVPNSHLMYLFSVGIDSKHRVANFQPLSVPFSPVANHTHSHYHQPIATTPITTPVLVKSQAQALPSTHISRLGAGFIPIHLSTFIYIS